ncbi:hypothetical protein ACHAPT_008332 [Fusarium lateritium]
MKVPVVSLAFAALALCGTGHASPCLPKPSSTAASTTAVSSTTGTSTDATASTSSALSSTETISSSTAESSSTEIVSSSTDISSTVTASTTESSSTAESSSTELPSSSTDVSSSTEVLTTSTTFSTETTSSVAPTTSTTSEEPSPTPIIVNSSFDTPNSDGIYDGAPWVLKDGLKTTGLSVSFNSNPSLAHSGYRSAFYEITQHSDRGRVEQPLSLQTGKKYVLKYWWLLNQGQPASNWGCYTTVHIYSGNYPSVVNDNNIAVPVALNAWTEKVIPFTAPVDTTKIFVYAFCNAYAGSGVKIAIDDITIEPEVI